MSFLSSILSNAEKAEAAAKSIQYIWRKRVNATTRKAAVTIQTQWRRHTHWQEKHNDIMKKNAAESDMKSGREGGGKEQPDDEQQHTPEKSFESSNHSLSPLENEEKKESPTSSLSINTFSSTLSQILQTKGQKNTSLFFFTCQDEESLERCMNFDFTETLLQVMQLGKSSVEAHVQAAHELLLQWEGIMETMSSRIPSNAQQLLLNLFDTLLYTRISVLYLDGGSLQDDISNVTPFESAMIVSLADHFLKSVARNPRQVIRAEWERDMDRLAASYMTKAVGGAMKECCDRALLLHSAEEIRRDGDLHLVTGLPELVSYMIEQQISVAKEALPQKYLEKVVCICNDVIESLVGNIHLRMGLKWKDIDSSFYCAIINDASRLAEQCEERNEIYLAGSEVQEKGNRLLEDLTELSLQGTNLLCLHIISHVCEPKNHILTSVGDDTWQKMESGDDAMKRTVATLEDYFTDVKLWLINDCYFAKLLRMSLDHVLQIYLDSFFQNTMERGIKNARLAAEKLGKDYSCLVRFYLDTNWEKYQDVLGLDSYQGILANLGILCNMAAIIMPDNKPQNVVEDVFEFLRRIPEGDGSAAVLHLVGLRGGRNQEIESVEWIEVIATAKKRIAVDRRIASLPLPDVRNSKYIRNFGPVRLATVQRHVSVRTLPHAQSTMKLLEQVSQPNPLLRTAQKYMAPLITPAK